MNKQVKQKRSKDEKDFFELSLDPTRLLIRERIRAVGLSYPQLAELAELDETTISKQLSLKAADNHKKTLSPKIVKAILPHINCEKYKLSYFYPEGKLSQSQELAIASERLYICNASKEDDDEGELIEWAEKNEIMSLDYAIQALKEVFFTLEIDQCYLLTKNFTIYTLLPLEAWKFLSYFTAISQRSKEALKLILQAHLKICDNTLHKNEDGIPIHPKFSDLLKELKNSISSVKIAEIETKESLWLELNKHITTTTPPYFSNDIEVVTGGLEESLTIDEDDIDILLLFIPFCGSHHNELKNILTSAELILRREGKEDVIW